MPGDDLAQHATSDHDFYELLGVNFETSESDIRRAYRKTALKYHPDKNAGNPSALEKFHLLQIAYDVLSDPTVKALYDNARTAKLQRRRQHELFEGKRKKMKEDLENRERGVKRGRDEEEDAEAKLEREIRRLAEDGKRRRKEREDLLRKEDQDENFLGEDTYAPPPLAPPAAPPESGGTKVPEIDRTIKVRWPRSGAIGLALEKDQLTQLFARFGSIENTFLLKGKERKSKSTKQKVMVATGVIVFSSIVGAHAAVTDAAKQVGEAWELFESVFWAGKEPDFSGPLRHSSLPTDSDSPSAPATPAAKLPGRFAFPNTPTGKTAPASTGADGLRRVPSFASFFSSFSTPMSSPYGKGGAASPSLEEITMIRLKNAERKRLEDEIRREDEVAEASGGKVEN